VSNYSEVTAVQFDWICRECLFTSTSSFSITMDYSCQVTLLDAAAVDSTAGVTIVETGTYKMEMAKTDNIHNSSVVELEAVAASTGGPISSISWKISPFYHVTDDSLNNRQSQGYTLVDISTTIERKWPDDTSNISATLLPLASGISITILLPIQTFYAAVSISEKTSAIQLMASIVGLSSVLGVFQMLFTHFERFFRIAATDTASNSVYTPDSENSENKKAFTADAITSTTTSVITGIDSTLSSFNPLLKRQRSTMLSMYQRNNSMKILSRDSMGTSKNCLTIDDTIINENPIYSSNRSSSKMGDSKSKLNFVPQPLDKQVMEEPSPVEEKDSMLTKTDFSEKLSSSIQPESSTVVVPEVLPTVKQNIWRRNMDAEGDVWYTPVDGIGDSVWEVPIGATIIE